MSLFSYGPDLIFVADVVNPNPCWLQPRISFW